MKYKCALSRRLARVKEPSSGLGAKKDAPSKKRLHSACTLYKCSFRDAGVAQLVEQRTENPRVGSSILSPGTTDLSTMDVKRLGTIDFFRFLVFFLCQVFHIKMRESMLFVGASVGAAGQKKGYNLGITGETPT